MEGYLHKRGRGKSIAIYKPYARRYFVLDTQTHELSYYTDISKKSYRGMVNVMNSEVKELSKATTGKSFCFALKCHPGRPHEETITLAAPNDKQLVEWINKIQEIGRGTVIWLPERNVAETQNEGGESDDPDDKRENVKTDTLIVQFGALSEWKYQKCLISYDFNELSFCADDSVDLPSPQNVTSTIDLVKGSVDVDYNSCEIRVRAMENDTIDTVIIVAILHLVFTDLNGKKSCYIAFQTEKQLEEWISAFKACGCVHNNPLSPSGISPPVKPAHSKTTESISDEYEMNDIDEDSVPSSHDRSEETYIDTNDLAQSNKNDEHPNAQLFDLMCRNDTGELNLTGFLVGVRRHDVVAKALGLPTNIKQDDGSRDRCIAIFEEMDKKSCGYIDKLQFVNYLEGLDLKKRQQYEFVEDPASYFKDSSPNDERKVGGENGSTEKTPVNSYKNGTPQSSKTRSANRSSFYEKLARTNEKEQDLEHDFLEKFRARNGMESAVKEGNMNSYEEEKKSTDAPLINGMTTALFGEMTDSADSLLSSLKFSVLEAVHPAKGVNTRLRLRELFKDDISKPINFITAQSFFVNYNEGETASLPDFFPFLREGKQCSWHDCCRYLRHCEQNMKKSNLDFKVKIEISMPSSGLSCIITSPILSWVRNAAKKIKTLPLSDMHILTLEEITDVIERKHCVDFAHQCATLCLIEMSGAENYIQFLEESTKYFNESSNADAARSSQSEVDRSFLEADTDKDGKISRSEWRRYMAEREEIVRAANNDKQQLLEENRRLRRALNSDEFGHNWSTIRETRAQNYELYLDVKNEEIAQLKSELEACKEKIQRIEGRSSEDYAKMEKEISNDMRQPFSPLNNEDNDHRTLELPDEYDDQNYDNVGISPPPSPPGSVSISISDSVPRVSIPDHYSQEEVNQQQARRENYIERLLRSKMHGQEETTGWTKTNKKNSSPRKKLVVGEKELGVPPSLNVISQQERLDSKLSSVNESAMHNGFDKPSHHPLHQALLKNTKTLDLSPIPHTARVIGTHTPKQKSPHKSFKDHTTSSRGKQLLEGRPGLFTGVRSPGNWSNSQVHLDMTD